MMKCKKVIVRNQQLYVCFLWIVYFTDKKKTSLADLLFRRSPDKRAILPKAKKGPQVQILQGARGFRYINYQNRPHDISENPMDSPKIRNAVFCAVILEEFVKELAAFSQEQAVLAQSEVWPWPKLIACFGSYIYCQTLCGNIEFLLSMQSTYQMNLIQLHVFFTAILSGEEQFNIFFFYHFY